MSTRFSRNHIGHIRWNCHRSYCGIDFGLQKLQIRARIRFTDVENRPLRFCGNWYPITENDLMILYRNDCNWFDRRTNLHLRRRILLAKVAKCLWIPTILEMNSNMQPFTRELDFIKDAFVPSRDLKHHVSTLQGPSRKN